MTYKEIVEATRDAVGLRNAARDALAERTEKVINDLLDANGPALAAVEVAGYRIERRDCAQDCSQWGSRVDYPGHRETHTLIVRGPGEAVGTTRPLARSLGVLDLGFFDGRNAQYARGPVTLADTDTVVRPATVAMLRAIAAALPAVAARAHADRQAAMAMQIAAAESARAALAAATATT